MPRCLVCKGPRHSVCLILWEKWVRAPWQNEDRPAILLNLIGIRRVKTGKCERCGWTEHGERVFALFSLTPIHCDCWGWRYVMNTRDILPGGFWEMRKSGICASVYILYVCGAQSFTGIPMPLGWYRYVIFLRSFPLYLPLWMSLCLSLCHYATACWPRVASLASMAQASTLKKCKAADQSGLEKQCTQKPQYESLFFLCCHNHPSVPCSDAPSRLWCRYQWSHLTERGQHAGPQHSGSGTSSLLIFG